MMNNTENKNFDFLHNISDIGTSLDMMNLQKSIYIQIHYLYRHCHMLF